MVARTAFMLWLCITAPASRCSYACAAVARCIGLLVQRVCSTEAKSRALSKQIPWRPNRSPELVQRVCYTEDTAWPPARSAR